jgi:2'-5' RNA ligase
VRLGDRTAQRHQATRKEAVDATLWWDFKPGQRVMTTEGFAGVVVAVSDGPTPGNEEYEVTLDAGMGGGAYAPGELAPLDPPLAAEAAVVASELTVTWDPEPDAQGTITGRISGYGPSAYFGRPVTMTVWPDNFAWSIWTDSGFAALSGSASSVEDAKAKAESAARSLITSQGSTAAATADVHTAADDYPELGDILERRPNHPHAIHVASLNADGQQVEAGWGERLFGPAVNRMYENLPPQFQTVEHGFVSSYDWCRFRRASHCWYSYQIDDEKSRELGRVVWLPQDRGLCPRPSWDEQKSCPIAEPGPHSKDPNAKPDATLPYDAGGQHLSSTAAYVDSKGEPYDINRRFELAKELGIVKEPFDWGERKDVWKLWSDTDKVLYDRWAKNDREVHIWTGEGKAPWLASAASLIAEAELQADPEWRFHFTASWRDVRSKAKRIRSEGGVRIIAAPTQTDTTVTAEVKGDHNIYETTIMREPGRQSVASWSCGCAWSSYSWGRSGRWKRYEGRMCSHALALTFEVQARGMFGRTVNEDRMKPPWRMDPTIPVVQPQNYPKPKKRSRASVEAPSARLRPVETSKDLEVAPAVLMAHAALSEGTDPNDVMASLVDLGCQDAPGLMTQALGIKSVPVKVRGIVRRLVDLLPGHAVLDNNEVVPLHLVTYPTYDPTLGLDPRDNVPHLAQGADTKGVMICFKVPPKLAKTLADLGTEDPDNIHITLAYFGKPDEVDGDALHEAVRSFAEKAPSLMAEVSGLGTFENDAENVLIATWDIPGIDRFRADMVEHCRGFDCEPYNNHGFTPHATLAYGDEPFRKLPALPDEAKNRFAITEVWLTIGNEWARYPLQPLGAKAAELQSLAMSEYEMANDLRDEAQQRRKQVEDAINSAAHSTKGRPITGTPFNVKGSERMAEKIREYARQKGVSAVQAAKMVNDALRFTIEWPTDDYAQGVGSAMTALSRAGLKPRVGGFKNYWAPGDPYQGINVVMETKDGFPWELQFHTPKSLETKEANHHDLEVVQNRNGQHSQPERKAAWSRMVQSASHIPIPTAVIPMGSHRFDRSPFGNKGFDPNQPRDQEGRWKAAGKEYRYFTAHLHNPAVHTTIYRVDTDNDISAEYLGLDGQWHRDDSLLRHLVTGGTNHDEIDAEQAEQMMSREADLASDWAEALTAGYESGEVDADAITWFAPSDAGQALAEQGAFSSRITFHVEGVSEDVEEAADMAQAMVRTNGGEDVTIERESVSGDITIATANDMSAWWTVDGAERMTNIPGIDPDSFAFEATKHDEPEPALPETDGGEDDDEVGPGHTRLAWLMEGATPGGDSAEIAAAARETLAKLSGKVFTPAEQRQIIDEGDGVVASNFDALDLSGTHYEALEAALADEEEDEAWLS